MLKCGVLYIAFGEKYRREALASIAAMRQFHPNLPCCIISETDIVSLPPKIQVLLRTPEEKYPFRSKAKYLRDSPFDRTLFLDTDTTTVRPIEDIFKLLDHFDIGVCTYPHYNLSEKYGYVTSINSGVILFRNSNSVLDMFDRWLELFDKAASAREEAASAVPDRGVWDDPHLIHAIYDSQARLVPLPEVMNFQPQFATVVASPIHIVHGRHPDPLQVVHLMDSERDSSWCVRTWVPYLGLALPHGKLRSAATWCRAPLLSLHVALSRLRSRLVSRGSYLR